MDLLSKHINDLKEACLGIPVDIFPSDEFESDYVQR